MQWSINWASLSFASYLLFWLSILGTALYVGLMLTINGVETLSMRYGSAHSLSTLLNWKMKSARARRLVNRWAPRLGMLMIGYVFGQSQLFNPVRELHNVSVIERHNDREFTVLIPAQSNALHSIDQVEVWKLCPWSDTLDLKPGVVFPVFQYKQKAGCQLIDSDTEVKYLRDKDHNVVDREGHILYVKGE